MTVMVGLFAHDVVITLQFLASIQIDNNHILTVIGLYFTVELFKDGIQKLTDAFELIDLPTFFC